MAEAEFSIDTTNPTISVKHYRYLAQRRQQQLAVKFVFWEVPAALTRATFTYAGLSLVVGSLQLTRPTRAAKLIPPR